MGSKTYFEAIHKIDDGEFDHRYGRWFFRRTRQLKFEDKNACLGQIDSYMENLIDENAKLTKLEHVFVKALLSFPTIMATLDGDSYKLAAHWPWTFYSHYWGAWYTGRETNIDQDTFFQLANYLSAGSVMRSIPEERRGVHVFDKCTVAYQDSSGTWSPFHYSQHVPYAVQVAIHPPPPMQGIEETLFDKAAISVFGEKASVGLICAYADEAKRAAEAGTDPRVLPGYCCLDAPWESRENWGHRVSPFSFFWVFVFWPRFLVAPSNQHHLLPRRRRRRRRRLSDELVIPARVPHGM